MDTENSLGSKSEDKRVENYVKLVVSRLEVALIKNKVEVIGCYLSEGYKIAHIKYDSLIGQEVWMLIVESDDGKCLGFRKLTILESDADPEILVAGNIEVFSRGKGIASKLDEVTFKLLQRLANNSVKKVKYVIDDANKERIDNIERELEADPRLWSEEKIDAIKDYRMRVSQRESWNRLYAPGGKLGFEKDEKGQLIKVIEPLGRDVVLRVSDEKIDVEKLIEHLKDAVIFGSH